MATTNDQSFDMSSFSNNKKGRALAKKLNEEYHRRIEEEYQKNCITSSNPKYSDWPEEEIEAYNEVIKRKIELKIRDEIFG